MAPRKKKKPARTFWNSLGKTAIKSGAGAALGASVGAIEVTVGEEASQYAKAGLAIAGVAGEIFIDPETSPILAEAAKASLYSGSALGGYTLGKKAAGAAKDLKHDREYNRMRDDLRSDLKAEEAEAEAARVEIPAGKRRRRERPFLDSDMNGIEKEQ